MARVTNGIAAERPPFGSESKTLGRSDFDPRLQDTVQVRHFDGAGTRKFVD